MGRGERLHCCGDKPHRIKHLRPMYKGNVCSIRQELLPQKKLSKKAAIICGLLTYRFTNAGAYCSSILLTAMRSPFTVPVTLTLMSFSFFRSAINCLSFALLAA